jgi:hypothetical protein
VRKKLSIQSSQDSISRELPPRPTPHFSPHCRRRQQTLALTTEYQPPSKAHSQIKMSSNHSLPPAPAASTHSQPRMSDPPIPTPPVAITRNWPSEALQNPRRSTFDDILTPPPVPGLLPLYVEQEYGQPSWCCIPRVKMFANYALGIVSFGVALFLIAYMIYAIITKPKTAEMVSGGLGVALSAPA